MILNILISLGIVIVFLAVLCVIAFIILWVVTNIEAFIKRKKEEIGLKKWNEIGNIIRISLFIAWVIFFLTFIVYVIIFT